MKPEPESESEHLQSPADPYPENCSCVSYLVPEQKLNKSGSGLVDGRLELPILQSSLNSAAPSFKFNCSKRSCMDDGGIFCDLPTSPQLLTSRCAVSFRFFIRLRSSTCRSKLPPSKSFTPNSLNTCVVLACGCARCTSANMDIEGKLSEALGMHRRRPRWQASHDTKHVRPWLRQ